MKAKQEPIITRTVEDRLIETRGGVQRLIETITMDYGPEGTTTVQVCMQPDITIDEWLERAKPYINDAIRPSGYQLAN